MGEKKGRHPVKKTLDRYGSPASQKRKMNIRLGVRSKGVGERKNGTEGKIKRKEGKKLRGGAGHLLDQRDKGDLIAHCATG